MRITLRQVVRQAIKCCFWCITIPAFLLFSLAVPILALMLWIWGSDDDDSLWDIFTYGARGYAREMGTLIV